MDRGAWRATVHEVVKSQTQLKRLSTHTHTYTQLIYNIVLLSGVEQSESVLYVNVY